MPVRMSELLERTLPPMGYEMVDCDLSASGRLVRVFIDKPGGVNVEDQPLPRFRSRPGRPRLLSGMGARGGSVALVVE